MRRRIVVRWVASQQARPGQSMVEFSLAIMVFLLFLFGIVQVAFLYKTSVALNQAATDAAHVLAAQSTSSPTNAQASWQSDLAALKAVRAALASQDLSGLVSIEIAGLDTSGNAKTIASLTESADLSAALTTAQSVTLDNIYQYSPGGSGSCQVDQFNLTNPLTQLNATNTPGTSLFSTCALPWNGDEFDRRLNQNGRNDQRCTEDRVGVKITYHYLVSSFPVHYDITLVGQDSTLLEPRPFLGNSATLQSNVTSC